MSGAATEEVPPDTADHVDREMRAETMITTSRVPAKLLQTGVQIVAPGNHRADQGESVKTYFVVTGC